MKINWRGVHLLMFLMVYQQNNILLNFTCTLLGGNVNNILSSAVSKWLTSVFGIQTASGLFSSPKQTNWNLSSFEHVQQCVSVCVRHKERKLFLLSCKSGKTIVPDWFSPNPIMKPMCMPGPSTSCKSVPGPLSTWLKQQPLTCSSLAWTRNRPSQIS